MIQHDNYDTKIHKILDDIVDVSKLYEFPIANVMILINTKINTIANDELNTKIIEHQKIIDHNILQIQLLNKKLK